MSDDMLRAAYGRAMDERGARDGECVTPEALLGVVDGSADEAARLATLRHVGSCVHCRAELDLMRAARDSALAVRPGAWWRNPALAAAAVVIVIAGTIAIWQTTAVDTLRSSSDAAVQLIAPGDGTSTALPLALAWSAVPTASGYSVEIMSPDGSVLFAMSTTDTVITVPSTAPLETGVDYRWWVRATTPGATPASPVRRLRIETP